jgi:hypothetical protein
MSMPVCNLDDETTSVNCFYDVSTVLSWAADGARRRTLESSCGESAWEVASRARRDVASMRWPEEVVWLCGLPNVSVPLENLRGFLLCRARQQVAMPA